MKDLDKLRLSERKEFRRTTANARAANGAAADDQTTLPIGGCLPMLLQFPLLIALYTGGYDFNRFPSSPFLWLTDLSAGDPYHFLELRLLDDFVDEIYAASPPSPRPSSKMQQKLMTYMMRSRCSGLCGARPPDFLFWLFGSVVSFVQQHYQSYEQDWRAADSEIVESVSRKQQLIKPGFLPRKW